MKVFWRCHVCNDIHYGTKPPETCPTCMVKDAYVEVSSDEALKVTSPAQKSVDKSDFIRAIGEFAEKREFQVNPDKEKVSMLLEGIFNCEKNYGMKYCPCRLIEKDFKSDLKLVCPCNFLIHETYKDKEAGECWCGLFVKRRKSV